jgi:hypothetical protein
LEKWILGIQLLALLIEKGQRVAYSRQGKEKVTAAESGSIAKNDGCGVVEKVV